MNPEQRIFNQINEIEKRAQNTVDASKFVLSGALRAKRTPDIYVTKDHPTDIDINFHLAEGQLHLAPPPGYREILHDPSYIEACYLAGTEYTEPNLEQAKAFVRERYGISESPYIAFSDGGSDRILKLITSLFSSSGTSTASFLGPCFPNIINFSQLTQDRNSRQAPVRLGEIVSPLHMRMDETVKKAMKERRPDGSIPKNKVFYLCNPTTPTGDVVDPELIRQFVEFCANTGNTLIIDEAFGDVLPDEESAIKYTEEYPNLIVTRSLSKILGMPGERIGYTVMSENEGRKYEEMRKIEAYNVAGPKQVFINKIMDPRILVPHAKENARKAFEIKFELMKRLAEQGILYLPTDERVPILTLAGDGSNFHDALLANGVESVSGEKFRSTHSALTGRYVRLTIPNSIEDIPELVALISHANQHSGF